MLFSNGIITPLSVIAFAKLGELSVRDWYEFLSK